MLSPHRQEYPAQLPVPQAPHVLHPWASSAGLGPHPCAAASTRGASCLPAPGLHPCPLHSPHPAGRPGPYSQTRTLSGTPHLPTPFGGALRTAGRRPKTWVPRPHGRRKQGPEPPAYTGTPAGHTPLPGCPPGTPPPPGVRNTTLHRKPSHWRGAAPPTHLQPVGPSQPSCPTGVRHCARQAGRGTASLRESRRACRRQGGARGGARSALTSTWDQVCPCGSCPRLSARGSPSHSRPTQGSPGVGLLWVPSCCPARLEASASGFSEAK